MTPMVSNYSYLLGLTEAMRVFKHSGMLHVVTHENTQKDPEKRIMPPLPHSVSQHGIKLFCKR